jgi:hypothetical protein
MNTFDMHDFQFMSLLTEPEIELARKTNCRFTTALWLHAMKSLYYNDIPTRETEGRPSVMKAYVSDVVPKHKSVVPLQPRQFPL